MKRQGLITLVAIVLTLPLLDAFRSAAANMLSWSNGDVRFVPDQGWLVLPPHSLSIEGLETIGESLLTTLRERSCASVSTVVSESSNVGAATLATHAAGDLSALARRYGFGVTTSDDATHDSWLDTARFLAPPHLGIFNDVPIDSACDVVSGPSSFRLRAWSWGPATQIALGVGTAPVIVGQESGAGVYEPGSTFTLILASDAVQNEGTLSFAAPGSTSPNVTETALPLVSLLGKVPLSQLRMEYQSSREDSRRNQRISTRHIDVPGPGWYVVEADSAEVTPASIGIRFTPSDAGKSTDLSLRQASKARAAGAAGLLYAARAGELTLSSTADVNASVRTAGARDLLERLQTIASAKAILAVTLAADVLPIVIWIVVVCFVRWLAEGLLAAVPRSVRPDARREIELALRLAKWGGVASYSIFFVKDLLVELGMIV